MIECAICRVFLIASKTAERAECNGFVFGVSALLDADSLLDTIAKQIER